MDEHLTTPEATDSPTRPFVQRTWVGIALIATGFVMGEWGGALVMAIVWAGFRLIAPYGEWRGPGWRTLVRSLIALLAVIGGGAFFTLWDPLGAQEPDEPKAEQAALFANLPTARIDVSTGVAGECNDAFSIATLGHTHASAFDAMREAHVELDHLISVNNAADLVSGQQLVRFGQGDGVLERLAIVAEERRDDMALLMVITAELFPSTTEGTAGVQRARRGSDKRPGAPGVRVPDRPESVVTYHTIGPCPPGLGLDFWANATRDPLSSPWALTEMPIPIASGPYRD